MKLPDANLLLYAYDLESPHHAAAVRWLESLLSGSDSVGFAWSVLLAFVRISTQARTFTQPLAPGEALDLVDTWLAQPNAVIATPGDRHAILLRSLIEPVGTAGNLTTDAHLAALAIEHGAEVCSADHDFGRFPGLRWSNPLASPPR